MSLFDDNSEALDTIGPGVFLMAIAALVITALVTFIPPISWGGLWFLFGALPLVLVLVGVNTYDQNFTVQHREALASYNELNVTNRNALGFTKKEMLALPLNDISDVRIALDNLLKAQHEAEKIDLSPRRKAMVQAVQNQTEAIRESNNTMRELGS